jgi:hypothetical protein
MTQTFIMGTSFARGTPQSMNERDQRLPMSVATFPFGPFYLQVLGTE